MIMNEIPRFYCPYLLSNEATTMETGLEKLAEKANPVDIASS